MTAKRNDITNLVLHRLYLEKKYSIYQIGKMLECHPSTINKKLHEYQIKIRHSFIKVNISNKKLNKLYHTQKLSTYKIAKLLGCNVRTITNKMRKYEITGRSIAKTPISKKTLLRLYRDNRLSLKKIGNLYNMTASGILKRMRKDNISLRETWTTNTGIKKPFTGSLKEKAYMIGFRLGDLEVIESSPKTKMLKISTNTTKKEQIYLVNKLFNKYSKVWIGRPNEIGVMSFSTILHPSFSFLLPKIDRIEGWIKDNDKLMTSFIAGYTDAEGSFGVYNNRAKFRLGSYDKNILKQINTWLTKMNLKTVFVLETKKKQGQNKDCWKITINEAKSLNNLYRILYLQLRHKKRKSDFDKVKKNIFLRVKNGTIRI